MSAMRLQKVPDPKKTDWIIILLWILILITGLLAPGCKMYQHDLAYEDDKRFKKQMTDHHDRYADDWSTRRGILLKSQFEDMGDAFLQKKLKMFQIVGLGGGGLGSGVLLTWLLSRLKNGKAVQISDETGTPG